MSTTPSLAHLPRRQPLATDPRLFTGRFTSTPPIGIDPQVHAQTADDSEPATEEEYRHQIGRRARLARIALNLSQAEVAARAGLTRNYISNVERGAQRLDTWRLRHLAAALDITAPQLLGIEETRPYLGTVCAAGAPAESNSADLMDSHRIAYSLATRHPAELDHDVSMILPCHSSE